jgi:glycosyltransferase involved in cell wall biosynthesis
LKTKKVALVHDWLTGMRGGEKVLEAALELFPQAEIYTLIYRPESVSALINSRRVHASWLNSLPGVRGYYRYLLPLMPRAIESFDLGDYDLVISFNHCVAKGVRLTPRPGRLAPLHVCYCHTPMRYVYDQFEDYFVDDRRSWLHLAAGLMRPFLTSWDKMTSRGVGAFVANSENVRERIRKAYGRDSTVIYPTVGTDYFCPVAGPVPKKAASYYLIAGALVPYKRVALAIAACRQLDVPLKIVGVGTEEKRLRELAKGAPVEFLGWQSDQALRELYRNCEAFLFPADEDFGIAAVEAMACGRPVIAYKKGGALESVRDGVTGVFFDTQTPEALVDAMRRAAAMSFDPAAIRAQALKFDDKVFKEKFSRFIDEAWDRHAASPAKTKVMLVLECGSPHGVGHQVAMITGNIDRERFDTRVVYAVRPGSTSEEFERMTRFAGGHTYIREMIQPISPFNDLIAFWKLYRLMRREKPGVVHAESSKAGALARAAAWLAGVPRIYYSPHGYSFLQTNAGPIGRAFYWGIEKSLSWIGNIVACSPGEAKRARLLSWGREVFLVRNLFVMDEPPLRARDAKDGTVLVGALGRLTRARNPEAFMRMAVAVAATHPNARFLWIGGGELEGEFRDLVAKSGIADKFEITGHALRETVLEKLQSLDVFVHYSLWEGGAPIALHEAMSFGKPVVVSNIAGNVDLVTHERTGLLAGDEDDFQRQVARLVESPELRAKLGHDGHDFLKSEVSLKKSMAELERLYSA